MRGPAPPCPNWRRRARTLLRLPALARQALSLAMRLQARRFPSICHSGRARPGWSAGWDLSTGTAITATATTIITPQTGIEPETLALRFCPSLMEPYLAPQRHPAQPPGMDAMCRSTMPPASGPYTGTSATSIARPDRYSTATKLGRWAQRATRPDRTYTCAFRKTMAATIPTAITMGLPVRMARARCRHNPQSRAR